MITMVVEYRILTMRLHKEVYEKLRMLYKREVQLEEKYRGYSELIDALINAYIRSRVSYE